MHLKRYTFFLAFHVNKGMILSFINVVSMTAIQGWQEKKYTTESVRMCLKLSLQCKRKKNCNSTKVNFQKYVSLLESYFLFTV